MIPIEKYEMISPVLKRVTQNVWECENETRKKNNETELDLFQEGFSIEECFAYKIDSIIFYFACNYSFLKVVEKNLLAARKNSPELFGTGDAQHIIDALYKESGQYCQKEEYCDFLRNYACCYLLYEKSDSGLSSNVLRLDLFRLMRPKENPNYLEFIGGILHALDHFSIDGQNLATGNDINDIPEIDNALIYIAKAFIRCEGITKKEVKVSTQMNTGKPMICVFYWDEKKKVYFLKTIHRVHD